MSWKKVDEKKGLFEPGKCRDDFIMNSGAFGVKFFDASNLHPYYAITRTLIFDQGVFKSLF